MLSGAVGASAGDWFFSKDFIQYKLINIFKMKIMLLDKYDIL
jgi:hypothetical protein